MNLVFFMPMRAASRFISFTNASSAPAAASASAMHASLPDCTTMPRTRSSTLTGLRGWMNMRDPGARQARSETFTCCSSVSFLSRSAWNTTYAVMSLVSDAGSTRSSGLSASSTCPLERSPTTQERPATAGGCGGAACTNTGRRRKTSPILFIRPAAKKRGLSHHDERLEIELRRDAIGHRARVVARGIRSDVQAPEVSGEEHLRALLEPRELVRDAHLQRLRVLTRGESADLHVDRAGLLAARLDALELHLRAAGLDEPE